MKAKPVEKGEPVEVRFLIERYKPELGRYKLSEYRVPVAKGMTVLEAIQYIQEKLDRTLAYRASCRMGTCGSCGMEINGVPMLACSTQVLALNSKIVKLRPLSNYRAVKDLVVHLGEFFDKHRAVMPYLIRGDMDEMEGPTREYLQTPLEQLDYLQFSYCIKCGLCNAACPIAASDEGFLGPQALTALYRYIADSRDEGVVERLTIADGVHGVWRCHFAGSCSMACPKGVDPALAIQLLKRKILSMRWGRVKRLGAPVAPPLISAKRREGIPAPPPPNV